MSKPLHIVIVTFPAQGHINPALQFAKRLVKMGMQVTFVTTIFCHNRIANSSNSTMKGLNFFAFSDGCDATGYELESTDLARYIEELSTRGSKALRDIITTSPVSCMVYSLFVTWAPKIANELHIQSVLLWNQPATVFDIFYFYLHGYEDEIKEHCHEPHWSIQLPGLPLLSKNDIPSLLVPSSSNSMAPALESIKEQLEILDSEKNPKVLVNTIDALEAEALKAVEKYNLVSIGPLIPSALLDGKDPSDSSFGGDLFQKTEDYLEWLNSQKKSSVVYVSFGSMLSLPEEQIEAIAKGLIDSGRPFLWVMRKKQEEEKSSLMEALEKQGKIVPWCSQLEVLTNPSLGCFVTHCGWNSTLESIAFGVPVVAFPQWTDQRTNAKMLQDVWRTGVRVKGEEDGFVGSKEIRRCIEMVMDGREKGREVRENVVKLKGLARDSVQGGSSDKNLKCFLEELSSF